MLEAVPRTPQSFVVASSAVCGMPRVRHRFVVSVKDAMPGDRIFVFGSHVADRETEGVSARGQDVKVQ